MHRSGWEDLPLRLTSPGHCAEAAQRDSDPRRAELLMLPRVTKLNVYSHVSPAIVSFCVRTPKVRTQLQGRGREEVRTDDVDHPPESIRLDLFYFIPIPIEGEETTYGRHDGQTSSPLKK